MTYFNAIYPSVSESSSHSIVAVDAEPVLNSKLAILVCPELMVHVPLLLVFHVPADNGRVFVHAESVNKYYNEFNI